MAQDERPVGERERARIVLLDHDDRRLGRRQRARDGLCEVGRRLAVAGCGARHDLLPPFLVAAVDAIARAGVAIDLGRGRLAPGGARDGDGARRIPEPQGIERRALELGDGELIDVLQVCPIGRNGFAQIAPRSVVVLGLQGEVAQGALELGEHTLLVAGKRLVLERRRLLPLRQGRKTLLGRRHHGAQGGTVALQGAGARGVHPVGEGVHVVGIALQQLGRNRACLVRLVGLLPGGHACCSASVRSALLGYQARNTSMAAARFAGSRVFRAAMYLS